MNSNDKTISEIAAEARFIMDRLQNVASIENEKYSEDVLITFFRQASPVLKKAILTGLLAGVLSEKS